LQRRARGKEIMMNNCRHRIVFETEGAVIPDNTSPTTTGGGGGFTTVRQWECLICGARFGYVLVGQLELDRKGMKRAGYIKGG
jgi:hypothetical protein